MTMGKTVEANAVISLNMEPARQKVEEFRKSVAEARQELQKLERTPVGALNKEDLTRMKDLRKEIPRMEKELAKAEKSLKGFRDTLRHLDKASINDLTNAKRALNDQIRKLTPGTREYIAATADYKKVVTRLQSLNNAYKQVDASQKGLRGGISRLTESFNKYFGMATTTIAAVTGLSMAFRKCAEEAAKLDDVYSDVMKTTGLLHEQVEELDQELMRIDTRTSREQLLLLARDAGKLGIKGKENILGFVRAADQIQVALGEDLGEGAIRNLGKIADVLGYTQKMGIEKALLSIASSINAVGQASTASEAYIVDFTQRLAGVSAQTNISAANIIGFASGLDQSAMKVEMAATAFQKFIMKLYEDPARFAEYANMQVKEFTDLLNTDANKAIITVLKSLKDKDGFASLVPIFKDLGLDGARAVSVLAAMATNINAVTEAQALANQEFEKAISVTEEYNTKNNNQQAKLEKRRKEFQQAAVVLGQKLNPILLKSTKASTSLIKALVSYDKEIKNVAITLAVLTAAVKANTIAHTVYQAVVKGITVVQKTFTVAINAASYAINIMRGRTVAATKAYLAMKAAMSTSVFGAIATAASALVVVITRLINKEKEAANAMSYAQSVEKKVVETYAEEEAKLRTLHAIIRDNNIGIDQRRKALQELQEIVPEYHASLSKEGQLIEGNTVFLEKYIEKLREATRWQVYKDEWQDLERQLIEVQDKITEFQQKAQDELTRNGNNATEKVETIVDTWGGGTKVQEYYTKYGEYMRSVNFYREKETELLAQQKVIHGKMGQMRKQETRELTDQEKEIDAIQKKYELLFAEAKNAYVGAPAEGMKAMGKLQEQMNKEIELVRKKYASPTTTTDGGGGGGSGLDDKAAKKAYEAKTQQLKLQLSMQERDLKISLAKREISEAEYNAKVYAATMENLRLRMEAAQMYGQDTTAIQEEFLDMQLKAIERQQKEEAEMLDAFANVRRDKAKKEAEEEAQRIAGKARLMATEQEILERNLQEVRERLGRENWKEEMDFELWKMQQLHEQGLLSERDYQEARLKVKMEYAQKGAEKVNAISEEASNFITAIREAESAQLEAQMQKDLTAAGNNAEERERIEAEYEEKQLELKKKYADVEMAINIAKTIASGAVAAIRAYAEGGPYAGVVLAALIAATTAAEVATIVAQRNAIKATSVSSTSTASSGSTDNTMQTGTRTITGYSEGGNTKRAASDATVVGVVHANEWVAPAWMVRENPTVFADLEEYRVTLGRGRKKLGNGFADGGLASPQSGSMPTPSPLEEIDWQALRDFNAIMRYCATHGIFVKYGDILIAKEKHDNFKKQTSR